MGLAAVLVLAGWRWRLPRNGLDVGVAEALRHAEADELIGNEGRAAEAVVAHVERVAADPAPETEPPGEVVDRGGCAARLDAVVAGAGVDSRS